MTKEELKTKFYDLLNDHSGNCDSIYAIEVNPFGQGAVRDAKNALIYTPITSGPKLTKKEIESMIADMKSTCESIDNAGWLCNKDRRVKKCKNHVEKDVEYMMSLVDGNSIAHATSPGGQGISGTTIGQTNDLNLPNASANVTQVDQLTGLPSGGNTVSSPNVGGNTVSSPNGVQVGGNQPQNNSPSEADSSLLEDLWAGLGLTYSQEEIIKDNQPYIIGGIVLLLALIVLLLVDF